MIILVDADAPDYKTNYFMSESINTHRGVITYWHLLEQRDRPTTTASLPP